MTTVAMVQKLAITIEMTPEEVLLFDAEKKEEQHDQARSGVLNRIVQEVGAVAAQVCQNMLAQQAAKLLQETPTEEAAPSPVVAKKRGRPRR